MEKLRITLLGMFCCSLLLAACGNAATGFGENQIF